jgi:L-ascorbate metabolism protein UlaG (beta-lactamase superfamily)
MTTLILASLFLFLLGTIPATGQEAFERDVVDTTTGKLEITFIGHGSLMFGFDGKIIHVDPFGQLTDYTKLPKADLILITHDHPDHLDLKALESVRTGKSTVILAQSCADRVAGGTVMRNGDVRTVTGIRIEALPAYNMVNKRPDGQFFHPRGSGNGYLLTFGGTRVYVAGDTENIPEMKALARIDIAFLPMNLPYTMTPEMVADAAKAFKPKVLYPYHYGDTDVSRLVGLLKGSPEIEVRIRKMK